MLIIRYIPIKKESDVKYPICRKANIFDDKIHQIRYEKVDENSVLIEIFLNRENNNLIDDTFSITLNYEFCDWDNFDRLSRLGEYFKQKYEYEKVFHEVLNFVETS